MISFGFFWLEMAFIVPNTCVKFGVQEKSGWWIMGQKGVKRGHLGSLSDFSRKILSGFFWFYAFEHRFIVASFCHKLHVDTVFRSGDMGRKGVSKTVPDGAFWHFLQKLSLVMADLLPGRDPSCLRYVCQVWMPGKIWFPSYGPKSAKFGKIVPFFYGPYLGK